MYTAISRKVVAKTVHATIPKGNIDTVAVEPTFVVSFSPRKHTFMASRAIL